MIDNTTPYPEMIEYVKRVTPEGKILLSFSGGKDSWACWIATRDHFDIYPFYGEVVPRLEFVEEYLAYAEKKIGQHIVRIPSPQFCSDIINCVFQPPERWPVIRAMRLRRINADDCARMTEETMHLPPYCWTAIGVRMADSQKRMFAMKRHGTLNDNRKVFYPVYDWNKDRLVDELTKARIRLPISYKLFGRSFDGVHLLYLYQIKKNLPRDYQRILDWFPLVDLHIFKYERYLERMGRHAEA